MNKLSKRFVSVMLTAIFSLSLAAGSGTGKALAAPTDAYGGEDNPTASISRKFSPTDSQNWREQKYGILNKTEDKKSEATYNPDEVVRVIVQMQDKPAMESGKNVESVKSTQEKAKAEVQKLAGSNIRNTYGYLINGFSTTVKRKDIDKIKAMPGVKKVTEAKIYYPDLKNAKKLTQVYETWKDYGIKGEGTVVAIIDSGIDTAHKDMKLTNPSKAKIKDIKKSNTTKYTSKIPYGYNFADRNDFVKDTTPVMHGMHVAGIVGANGDENKIESNEAVQGVAPECQLLAMKVFSNDPNNAGAFSDDIVAAIEDSVLRGADIINMSLGSPAAFQDPDDPEQKAVKNAVDKGVMVVVSAGNSTYSTAPYKFGEIADTGLVGAPGLAHDTLQVASYNNLCVTGPGLEYTSSEGNSTKPLMYTTSEVDPVVALKSVSGYELVDCGLGNNTLEKTGNDFNPADNPNKVKGKIALVQKVSGTYGNKKRAAQAAGAIGVIFYNAEGDDSLVSTSQLPEITVPAICTTYTNGAKLKSLIDKKLRVVFRGAMTEGPNPTAGDMSDYSSWGPTPNLDFKPEITAPGGNIWSTANDNKYQDMSGTSMAAPHTSGLEALLRQAINSKNIGLNGRELVEFTKATTINTALTEMDKMHNTVPYSPRRQGAGMAQIENAIKNNVIVKDDNGNAAVSLKQMGKEKSYNLTLKNYGDKAATYTINDIGGVLTEQGDFSQEMSYDVKIDKATITFDKKTVTVPAKGSETVKVSISLPDDFATEQFVEGFVKFTSKDSNVPSLVSPFIGFYGDWSKPRIIDAPMWDENAIWGESALLTSASDGDYNYLGYTGKGKYGPIIDPNKIAISPNNDGYFDNVVPKFTFFRNAKELKVQLLDKNKKPISQVAIENNVSKNLLAEDPSYTINPNWAWDGKAYNTASGKYETVPEGQYYLNYITKVDITDAKEQDYIIPVKVDLTAPQVKVTSPMAASSTAYKLQWTENDDLSGIDGIRTIFLNGVEQKDIKISNSNGMYSCDLNLAADKVNIIEIVTEDYAGNQARKQINVKEGNVAFNINYDNLKSDLKIYNSNYKVTGNVSYKPAVLKINGIDAAINNDLSFNADIKLFEGINYVSVYAEDLDGTVLINYSIKVSCDTVAPVINLTSPIVNEDGKVYINGDNIVIKGTVCDNTYGYKLYINGNQMMKVELNGEQGEKATLRNFEYSIPVSNNSFVEIKAVDLFNHETVKNLNIVIDKDKPIITIKGVEDKTYNTNVKPVVTANEGKIAMTLNGKTYNGEEITEDGKYELIVNAVDAAGNTSEAKVNFVIDKIAPAVPTIKVDNTNLTNKDVMVTLTSDVDAKIQYSFDKISWIDYDKTFAVDSNKTVYARAKDSVGNISEVAKYEIKNIDKTAPAAPTIKINTTEPINTDVTILIQAEDGAIVLYSFDNEKWDLYSKALVVAENKTVYAKAIDKAGNASEISKLVINNIDKITPTIIIKGVEDGKTYTNSVKPEISTTKGNLLMLLDGKEYNGDAISTVGQHELIVKAQDTAGNTTSKTIKFTIASASSGNSSQDNAKNETSTTTKTMPKTGSVIDNKVLSLLGLLLIGAGFVVCIARKKEYK